MRLLLDTHTFLWFSRASPESSTEARDLIEDTENELFLSIASPWETGIKVSTGELTLGRSADIFFKDRMQRSGIALLPITLAHIACVSILPFHHRDPFDRMLIAQSLTDNLPIISADAAFDPYGVMRFW